MSNLKPVKRQTTQRGEKLFRMDAHFVSSSSFYSLSHRLYPITNISCQLDIAGASGSNVPVAVA